MAQDDSQGTRNALINRFEEGLMLASDKRHILALLRSLTGRYALDALLAGASPDGVDGVNRYEKAEDGTIDWKMEADRANRLLALAEAQVETWRDQASQKDAELTLLRDQVARHR